jgi:hypothetical protein
MALLLRVLFMQHTIHSPPFQTLGRARFGARAPTKPSPLFAHVSLPRPALCIQNKQNKHMIITNVSLY